VNADFDRLFEDYLDGRLDERGISELEQQFQTHPDLVRYATDLMEEHRLLGVVWQPFNQQAFCDQLQLRLKSSEQSQVERILGNLSDTQASVSTIDRQLSRSSSRTVAWLALAVAACLGIAFGWWNLDWQRKFEANRSGESAADVADASKLARRSTVATLVYAKDCRWSGQALEEGQPIVPGLISLESGTAMVRFLSGVEMAIEDQTKVDLQAANHAVLERGQAVFRASGDSEGFSLTTPTAEIIELGRELSVKVSGNGDAELHLMEGEGRVRPSQSKTEIVNLKAGEAVKLVRLDGSRSPVPIEMKRLGEVIKKTSPGPRPDLMRAYEGFQYDPADYEPSDLSRGQGWAGPWRLRNSIEQKDGMEIDSNQFMRIVHGQIDVRWPILGGRKGMLQFPAGLHYRLREMKDPVVMSRRGVTYFSLMVHEPDRSARDRADRPKEALRFTFRSSQDYWKSCISFGVNRGQRAQIQATEFGSFQGLAKVPDEQSLLWIGKIVRRPQGEDEVYFRIYGQEDVLDFAEPSEWHVESRRIHDDSDYDLVVLSSTGLLNRVVDEIRIGPTWRSVVPVPALIASLP
jgi:hypothetical protein